MDNKKIIIKFGFRIIWRIMEILECVVHVRQKQKKNKSICLYPETFSLSR